MKGAVTASTQEAADAGVEILRAGGNAVDAAVAAALASCVADPCNTGIGGYGGYLVLQRSGHTPMCVAFPLSPPGADAGPPAPDSAGPAASTLPNVLAGLARALDEFGSQPWSRLCQRAIVLARDGVTANSTTSLAFAHHRALPVIGECFELEATGDAPQPLRFRQPLLAATLEALAEHGPDWFYRGPLAEAAASAWQAAGLDLRAGDWRDQPSSVFVEPAACWTTHGVRLHSAPLALSGSATVFAFLEAAARIGAGAPLERPNSLAALAQAMARVWQHRFTTPAGNDIDAGTLGRWIDAALAADSAAPLPRAAEHTAHINAADAAGNLAALTFTHGPTWFGGRWAIPGSGVLMNAGMQNSTRAPLRRREGRRYGVSNMSPTLASDGSRTVAIGCPGARRIPSNIAIALARLFFAGSGLQASVSGGRFHAETPHCAHAEFDRLGAETVAALRKRFAEVLPESDEHYFGPLSAVAVAAGGVEAAVDDRGFAGYRACTD